MHPAATGVGAGAPPLASGPSPGASFSAPAGDELEGWGGGILRATPAGVGPRRPAKASGGLACLLPRLGLQRPVLVGHSFGGELAPA